MCIIKVQSVNQSLPLSLFSTHTDDKVADAKSLPRQMVIQYYNTLFFPATGQVDGPIVAEKVLPVASAPPQGVDSWSQKNVHNWLHKNQLSGYVCLHLVIHWTP